MTADATFGTLVDQLIGGQAVTSPEFAPELRVASLLFASRPAPSPVFAASLERRLAAGLPVSALKSFHHCLRFSIAGFRLCSICHFAFATASCTFCSQSAPQLLPV